MFMRYRGGGVGHASTRDATNFFLSDRNSEELKAIHVVDDIPELTGAKTNDELDDGEADECDYGYNDEEDDDSDASKEGDNASDEENSEPEAGDDDNDVQEVFAQL